MSENKKLKTKGPTKLAVGKNIRRSLLNTKTQHERHNVSVVIVKTKSSSKKTIVNNSEKIKISYSEPIVISDSDDSEEYYKSSPNTKNGNKVDTNNMTISSDDLSKSHISDSFIKDFDALDLTETNEELNLTETANKNRLKNKDNSVNFVNETPRRNKKVQVSECNVEVDDCVKVLDEVYGNKWRKNDKVIIQQLKDSTKKLPKSERKVNIYENSYLEENYPKSVNALEKITKKINKTPHMNILKDLHDTNSSSDDAKSLKVVRKQLNYISSDSESENENNYNLLNIRTENKTTNKEKPKNSKSDKLSLDKLNILSKKQLNTNDTNKQTKISKEENVNTVTTIEDNNIIKENIKFLLSLSPTVPESLCFPTAKIFKNDFKILKEKLAKKLFDIFNSTVFNNSIHKETPLEWSNRLLSTAGYCACKKILHSNGQTERKVRIVLSLKVLDSPAKLRDTLLHEMCHAATWIVHQVSDGHGTYWKSWASKAMKIYSFLPPVTRCHNYYVKKKYTYKCTKCGYSINRHKKTLDVEKKRCGYCHGKFDILMNKENKRGSVRLVPVTPKKEASGFARFVQEHYATFRSPQVKHGEVMKLLGQKFTDMKC